MNPPPLLSRLSLPGWLVLASAALAGPCAAQVADHGVDNLRFSAFGTLGAAFVDAPAGWVYRREFSQPLNSQGTRFDLDSRLGLQVNYSPSAAIELVGQANLRRRAPVAGPADAVEWAFAAWRPNADWTLRLGRVNLDAFLMSDHRSVGFAYPYARPPTEFYAQLPSSLNGVDAARVWNDGSAQWRAKLLAGHSRLSFDSSNKLDLKKVLGGMVSRESDGLLMRVSAFQARLFFSAPPLQPLLAGLDSLALLPVPGVAAQAGELRSRMTLDDAKPTYVSVGAQVDRDDWLLSGELVRVTGSVPVSFSAGYVSLGRRWGPVTVFGVAGRISRSSRPAAAPVWEGTLAPLIGPAAAQQAQFLGTSAATVVNSLLPKQSTFALGTRWDLGPRLALKVQWDHIRVAENGSSLWGAGSTVATRANVGAVVLDFVF